MSEAEASAAGAGNAETAPNAEAAAAKPAETTTSWRDSLPEDIKANPTLSKFETVEGMAKSYVNLERMLGGEKVPIPKDGDQEAWDRFYKAGGRPDAPEQYGFKAPEKLPEGVQYSAELDKQLAGIFHKQGLNSKQAAGVREELMGIVSKGALESLEKVKADQQANEAAIQKAEETLKSEWGSAYEARMRVAGAAIREHLRPEFIALLEESGIANNPIVVRNMYDMGVKMSGEQELLGKADMLQSPSDIDAAIAEYRMKNYAALHDSGHPENAFHTKKLAELYARLYPQAPA